jgi:hypothetical protein
VNDIYVVDADFRYGLSPDMRDALDNGITLAFDVEVEIRQPRRYLWDPLVMRSVQRLRLEYHALSRTYLVSNDTTRTRQSFPTLDEALLELGHMRGAAISETRHLPENGGYTGRIRVRLDVDALPAPLRPIAYLSPDWHLSSSWRQWEVKP